MPTCDVCARTGRSGTIYGVLCLKFSKEKINAMAAEAEAKAAAQSRRVLMIVLGTSLVDAVIVICLSRRLDRADCQTVTPDRGVRSGSRER